MKEGIWWWLGLSLSCHFLIELSYFSYVKLVRLTLLTQNLGCTHLRLFVVITSLISNISKGIRPFSGLSLKIVTHLEGSGKYWIDISLFLSCMIWMRWIVDIKKPCGFVYKLKLKLKWMDPSSYAFLGAHVVEWFTDVAWRGSLCLRLNCLSDLNVWRLK